MLSNNKKAIALLDSGILSILPQRNTRGAALPNTVDTHVWLEPNNAVRIGFLLQLYVHNSILKTKRSIGIMQIHLHEICCKLLKAYDSSSNGKPYWSYHDAYQYLERSLNLKFAGALTDDPHVAPTAAQIKYLNDSRPKAQMCLLAESFTTKGNIKNWVVLPSNPLMKV